MTIYSADVHRRDVMVLRAWWPVSREWLSGWGDFGIGGPDEFGIRTG
jgi:hypothetical protein